jgi:hypothetical protein
VSQWYIFKIAILAQFEAEKIKRAKMPLNNVCGKPNKTGDPILYISLKKTPKTSRFSNLFSIS